MVKQDNNPTNWIKSYWGVIIFIGGMLITWGVFITRIENMNNQLQEVRVEVSVNQSNYNELKNSLIRIETTLDLIKENLVTK